MPQRLEGLGSGLSVACLEGVAAIESFGAEIDRLNALTSRRSPFLSGAFLLCYALWAEYHTPGCEERLYIIREGERLIGIAPMHRSIERLAPEIGPLRLRGVRLTMLAPLDTDQPGILSAPEDAARVGAALINHLCTSGRDWDLLEFAGQCPGTPLHDAVHAAANHLFRARDIEVEPYTEIPIVWTTLARYFRSLTKKMRSNISRQARRQFARGQMELVLAEGSAAVSAWFDAYCDLDSRSWKQGTQSSIQRHSRRVRFYREIAAGRAGLDPSFIGVLLDGVLIAGLLVGSNGTASPEQHGSWCLEMAYDQSLSDLGPGQLLLLLAMGEAIRRGDRFLSFMQNYSYYKRRWGAAGAPVVNVQLLRRRSLHDLRATVGEWCSKMRLRSRKAADAEAATPQVLPPRAPAPSDLTKASALTKAALSYQGPGIRRLDRHQARVFLPFDVD